MISSLHPKRFETSFFPKFFFLLRTDSSRIHRIRFYPFEDKRNFWNLETYNERSYWIISSIIDIKLSIHHCGIVAEIVIDFCWDNSLSIDDVFRSWRKDTLDKLFPVMMKKNVKISSGTKGKKIFFSSGIIIIRSLSFPSSSKREWNSSRELLTSETSLITENYVKSRKGDWILFNDPV